METTKKPGGRKKFWLIGIALLLVLAIAAALLLNPFANTVKSSVTVVSELRSGTAQLGTITENYTSGGTIAAAEAQTVSLAGSITLTSWAVSEGDYVEAGTLLATADKNSVLTAISDVNDLLEKLDAAIEESRSETGATSVTAPAAGRVMQVYARSGDAVTDVMYEYGALALLSLDGLLAADIESDTLTIGDKVTVMLPDGTALEGTVASRSESTVTVTVSDTEATLGDTVTVSDSDGAALGTAELRINSELRVVGYEGTISSVGISEGKTVSAGQQLFALTDAADTSRYELLSEQRRTLAAQLQELFAVYETGGIYAETSGVVSGLNEDIVGVSASTGGGSFPSGGFQMRMARLAPAYRVTLLTDAEPEKTGTDEEPSEAPTPDGTAPGEGEDPAPSADIVREVIGKVTEVRQNEDGTVTVVLRVTDGSTLELSADELGTQVASVQTGDLLVLGYTEDGIVASVEIYRSTSSSGGEVQDSIDIGGGVSFGGFSTGTGTETEEDEDYTMSETELCTLTPYDTAEILLTVDELDIGSLSAGQPVTVTLDALAGQSFSGSITEIDPNGSYSGGSTKYTVTVRFARTSDMLEGMNATVSVQLAEHEDLLLIPAAAVQEDESGSFVYTAQDADGSPVGRTAVTTGLSDGENVEILSGLTEGGSYFYTYASSLEYSFGK